MTRFARAKGSKASNSREAEEATDWSEFKQQIKQEKTEQTDGESEAHSTLKRLKREEVKPGNSEWADFGDQHVHDNLKILSKKRNAESDDTTSELKKKKKKRDRRTESEVRVKCETENQERSDGTYLQQKQDQDTSPIQPSVSLKKKKKKNVKKREEDVESEGLNEVEDQHHLSSKYVKNTKIDQGKEQPSFHSPKNFQMPNAVSDMKKNSAKFKRRKPFVQSTTIDVNGVTINVTKFDGYDVKTEDATRLRELRSKMLKEGIPIAEVDKAMKLERRRAEKALAREKKKVCFNCRKAGHLLSECPEVGSSFGSKTIDVPAVNICYKCGSTEHTHFQCLVKKDKKYSFATCFICKEQGHISSQCPDNPRGLYPQGGCCKICGEVTHLKKDCPQLSKERSENTLRLDRLTSDSNLESLGEDVELSKPEKKISKKSKKVVKF